MIFQELGASLWMDKTRAALGRIGGRATSPLDLTPTGERVAELVTEGQTNREVAASLFLSVKTVETNLTRIYPKLGVAHAGSSRGGCEPGRADNTSFRAKAGTSPDSTATTLVHAWA